ncbi:MAG: hypothetical protein QY309_13390 [Cyclobacteriaceae bacterium]|nr:MAG: hypothetical protein QY309_13300 [Cyclobacteriaceae bacterium]WKZ58861.1 MAG: hypothetical protein QY309_13390 [Cyclobacteriaceae bacterium]
MDFEEKIGRVDNDLDKGLKKRAIDRLHGLIKTYPDELRFRTKLGHIYLGIGFKDNAGQYFLLEKDRTIEMDEAVTIYLDSVNKSGWKILSDIQFQGNKDNLNNFAKQQLTQFEEWSKKETGHIPTFRRKKIGMPRTKQKGTWDFGAVLIFGVLISVVILTIIGLVTVIRWIF